MSKAKRSPPRTWTLTESEISCPVCAEAISIHQYATGDGEVVMVTCRSCLADVEIECRVFVFHAAVEVSR